MRTYDKVFDALYVNLVEAGETGGILDTILQRLSSYIEKNVKLKRAVKSALVYPVAVLLVAAGVIVLLLWKVVPIFATLFTGLGVNLPLPTRIVIGLSNFVGSIFGLLILVGFVGAGLALKVWYGTPVGRMAIDGTLSSNYLSSACSFARSRSRDSRGLLERSSPAACPSLKAWTSPGEPRETP